LSIQQNALVTECIKACPQKAIKARERQTTIDKRLCDGDGICIPACPKRRDQAVEE